MNKRMKKVAEMYSRTVDCVQPTELRTERLCCSVWWHCALQWLL